jgi:hypothetical protein
MPIRVTAWGEHRHQKKNAGAAEIYQGRIYEAIAGQLPYDPEEARCGTTMFDPQLPGTPRVICRTPFGVAFTPFAVRLFTAAVMDLKQALTVSSRRDYRA